MARTASRASSVRAAPPASLLAALLCGCAAVPAPWTHAEPWPEADAAFQRDRRWLGGDACYSVPLGHDRILWLFGDSFVDPQGRADRRRSSMVRNTIALQQGADPSRARIAFHWGEGDGGEPLPFFADAEVDGERLGVWPLHGVRVGQGPLLLFQTLVRNTPGQGLGFMIAGWRVLRVDDPDAPPPAWRMAATPPVPSPPGAMMGTAAWLDGDHLLALGSNGQPWHPGILCRFRLADLAALRAAPEWWDGHAFHGDAAPAVVLPQAGPECSLHPDPRGRGWLHLHSRGFGSTTLAVSRAPSPTGPFAQPRDVFTPPENARTRPFVYAGKAHPELDGGGALVATYAANAFDFGDLFTDTGQRELYWPRFVRLR